MAPQSASGPTALVPNAFSRSGYTFTGWNTAPGGSGTAFANRAVYSFTANLTLFAQWSDGPTVVTRVIATQTGPGEVTVSWASLGGRGFTYQVTLYSSTDASAGVCSTGGRSCTVDSVLPGTYSVAVAATVDGTTSKPALAVVRVTGAKPSLTDAWRGNGKDAKRAYATVAIPEGADPAAVLIWRLVKRAGKDAWVSRPVIRDAWTCRYARSQTVCTWEQITPTRARIKFSANGMFTEVARFRSPQRA